MEDRPAFIVYLRPTSKCRDPIKSLRAVLKRSLRDWGLRCTTITSRHPSPNRLIRQSMQQNIVLDGTK